MRTCILGFERSVVPSSVAILRTIVRGASSLTSDRVMSSDGSYSSDCTCHYTVYHIFGKEDKEVCWGGAYWKRGRLFNNSSQKGGANLSIYGM